jgi:purine-cytosine permease-like protein
MYDFRVSHTTPKENSVCAYGYDECRYLNYLRAVFYIIVCSVMYCSSVLEFQFVDDQSSHCSRLSKQAAWCIVLPGIATS